LTTCPLLEHGQYFIEGQVTRRGLSVDPLGRGFAEDVKQRPPTLIMILANALIDITFLIVWFFVHYQADVRVFDQLELSGVTRFSASVLQWSFDISTLIPILAFLFADTLRSIWRIMLVLMRSLTDMYRGYRGG
jgi:hypothetical protein